MQLLHERCGIPFEELAQVDPVPRRQRLPERPAAEPDPRHPPPDGRPRNTKDDKHHHPDDPQVQP
jgi:hypothetical protein